MHQSRKGGYWYQRQWNYINGNAFASCTRLEILDINSNVNRSGDINGIGTNSLELVNIGPDVTTIASNLFASCVNLQIVNFGDNSTVDTIGVGAFFNCSQHCNYLSKFTQNINNSAFADCTQLAVTFTPGSSDYQIVLGSNVFNNTPLADQFDEGVITF